MNTALLPILTKKRKHTYNGNNKDYEEGTNLSQD